MAAKSGSNGGMQVDTDLVRELADMLNGEFSQRFV